MIYKQTINIFITKETYITAFLIGKSVCGEVKQIMEQPKTKRDQVIPST